MSSKLFIDRFQTISWQHDSTHTIVGNWEWIGTRLNSLKLFNFLLYYNLQHQIIFDGIRCFRNRLESSLLESPCRLLLVDRAAFLMTNIWWFVDVVIDWYHAAHPNWWRNNSNIGIRGLDQKESNSYKKFLAPFYANWGSHRDEWIEISN